MSEDRRNKEEKLHIRCLNEYDKRWAKKEGKYDYGDFSFELFKEILKLKKRLRSKV